MSTRRRASVQRHKVASWIRQRRRRRSVQAAYRRRDRERGAS